MCGRYTIKASKKQIEEEFKASINQEPLLKARYNIAPTQIVAVVVEVRGERRLCGFRWGLIPSWAKDESIGNKLINARAETLAEKPSFKNAFRSRRCLVAASGFYEWQKKGAGPKQPVYFYLPEREVVGFAGLWEEWIDRETGECVESCTIITTEANELVEPVHERMPVILKPENYDEWLDETRKQTNNLQNLLVPYPSTGMASYAVSLSVNSPRFDSAEMIAPLA